MPGIWAIGLADGLAEGIGIFIGICGDAVGVGDAVGIWIPGICVCIWGVGDDWGVEDGFAICIVPSVGEGDGRGVAAGIGIPCLC